MHNTSMSYGLGRLVDTNICVAVSQRDQIAPSHRVADLEVVPFEPILKLGITLPRLVKTSGPALPTTNICNQKHRHPFA
jgi:hypothetical protein